MKKTNTSEKQYSEEEIKKMEQEQTAYYESKLPFLRLKAEFDTLHMEIAEARIRTLQANHSYYQAILAQEKTIKEAKEEPENSKKNGSN